MKNIYYKLITYNVNTIRMVVTLVCALIFERIVDVMVDHGFKLRSGQTKNYKIDIVASPLNTQH